MRRPPPPRGTCMSASPSRRAAASSDAARLLACAVSASAASPRVAADLRQTGGAGLRVTGQVGLGFGDSNGGRGLRLASALGSEGNEGLGCARGRQWSWGEGAPSGIPGCGVPEALERRNLRLEARDRVTRALELPLQRVHLLARTLLQLLFAARGRGACIGSHQPRVVANGAPVCTCAACRWLYWRGARDPQTPTQKPAHAPRAAVSPCAVP